MLTLRSFRSLRSGVVNPYVEGFKSSRVCKSLRSGVINPYVRGLF